MTLLMEGLFALQTKLRLGPACELNIAHSAGVIGANTLASDKLSDNIVEVVDIKSLTLTKLMESLADDISYKPNRRFCSVRHKSPTLYLQLSLRMVEVDCYTSFAMLIGAR